MADLEHSIASGWDTRRSKLILVALIAVLLGDLVVLVGRAEKDEGPEQVAAEWTRASLAGDCGRLFALSTTESREFFDAIGGCPLGGRVAGRVSDTSIREERSDAAVVIVDVEGPGITRPLELLLVRQRPDDAWRVEMRAASACASLAGQPPEPGDCKPLKLPQP